MRIFEEVGGGKGVVRLSRRELQSESNYVNYANRELKLAGLVEPFEILLCWPDQEDVVVMGTIAPQFE